MTFLFVVENLARSQFLRPEDVAKTKVFEKSFSETKLQVVNYPGRAEKIFRSYLFFFPGRERKITFLTKATLIREEFT